MTSAHFDIELTSLSWTPNTYLYLVWSNSVSGTAADEIAMDNVVVSTTVADLPTTTGTTDNTIVRYSH
jgi:hypothetical protein